ncbi:MAG: tRNA (guanine-N(7)-)-methyltransferase [Lysobacteraceae bacterium]|nr:MAG: tRNA (guanine-N(7)-)-methyltransferase [Xanthomonadaceae bacterium]
MSQPEGPPPERPGMLRPIRSFVLRQGRLTPAQQRAFEQHWTRLGRELAGHPVDWAEVFGRRSRLVLEIGFGNGEALRWAAREHPDWDFLGIEVHRPGVGRLLNGLNEDGSENVRIYCHDAVEVLERDIGPCTLDEVRIWFPDPWHKKRHHKRRLIQPPFVALLAARMKDGALLHLATDWQAYAEHMLEVLEASPAFRNLAGPGTASPRPPTRPETHFERRGQRLGHGVWDLLYQKMPAS